MDQAGEGNEEEFKFTTKKQREQAIKDQEEEPKDYEVFLDIKRSYENSLAKMDTLVRKLQDENRVEKLKRLKFQRIAEEIQDRENTIISNLQNKFDAQLIQQTEANRRKIAGEYKYALKVQKQTVKQQMESIVGQNMIIKKLS